MNKEQNQKLMNKGELSWKLIKYLKTLLGLMGTFYKLMFNSQQDALAILINFIIF